MVTAKNTLQNDPLRVLGVFALTTMGIAAILSLRNLPIAAMYGLSAVSFYLIAGLIFMIPSALVCGRLAAHVPQAGGLYAWVTEAFGDDIGLLAIWLEWINTIISFPMMFTFIIFTLIFPLTPELSNNKFFEFGIMLFILWGISLINFWGIKTSSRFGSICLIIGTIFPALLIIILGLIWLLQNHAIHIAITWHALTPSFDLSTLAFLIAVINGLSGIQIIAFHNRETINPHKTYPLAMLCIVMIILLLSILATTAIALVMPHQSPSVIGGLITSFSIFFKAFHLAWITPIIAICIAFGVLAEINAWIIGPSKGIFAAATNKQLPEIFRHANQHNVPVNILIIQASIASILGLAYVFMPSVSSAYWLLSDLTGQFTLLMWLLVFGSAIYLSLKNIGQLGLKEKLKSYGIIFAALLGMLVATGILIVSYIPPSIVIQKNTVLRYEMFLLGGLIIFLIIPIYWRRYTWKRQN